MIALVAGKHRTLPPVRVLLRTVVALVVTGVVLLVAAQAASAHAELVSTTPQDGATLEEPPAEVVLTFNEPVQLLDDSMRLFPGDGSAVPLDAHVSSSEVIASLPAELGDGSYALSYRVVSADGHPISGAITFTIGEGAGPSAAPTLDTATPQATQLAVRVLTAIHYLTLFAMAGLVFFERAVLRGARALDDRAVQLLRWSGVGAVVASALLIPVSALHVTGSPLLAVFTPSAWKAGVLWAPVVTAGLVLLGVAVTLLMRARGPGGAPGLLISTTAPLLALLAPVLIGHTQLVEPRTLIVLADIGHLLAGSFWTGGVIGLLLLLAGERRAVRLGTGEPERAARVVDRFSRWAVWSALVLALSGTLMALMILDSVEALLATAYGRTLLVKLGIVALIAAIAGYNRLRLLPRLSSPTLSSRPTAHVRWRLLTRTLTCEVTLLIVVLIITGFLTTLRPGSEHEGDPAPSHAAAAAPVIISAQAQELGIEGVLEPASTGDHRITFALHYEGEPVTPDEVALRVTLPDRDLGPYDIVPDLDPESGEYTAELALPVAGQWQVQVSARVSTFAEPVVTIPVTIR